MTDIKTELLKTIDRLKSIESLSNYRFELNRYESAIKVIDLWIEDTHRNFDKNYAIVAKENDLYNLSFETTFDYRDTFDERLASELISNGLKFEIYKNKLTVSRVDLALQDLSEMIDYVANELRYFGQIGESYANWYGLLYSWSHLQSRSDARRRQTLESLTTCTADRQRPKYDRTLSDRNKSITDLKDEKIFVFFLLFPLQRSRLVI